MGGAPLDWETFMREHVERRPTEQSLLYHVELGERLRLLLIAAAYDAEAVLHARCELVEQSAPKADLYQLHRAHKRAIRQRLAPLQCVCRALCEEVAMQLLLDDHGARRHTLGGRVNARYRLDGVHHEYGYTRIADYVDMGADEQCCGCIEFACCGQPAGAAKWGAGCEAFDALQLTWERVLPWGGAHASLCWAPDWAWQTWGVPRGGRPFLSEEEVSRRGLADWRHAPPPLLLTQIDPAALRRLRARARRHYSWNFVYGTAHPEGESKWSGLDGPRWIWNP